MFKALFSYLLPWRSTGEAFLSLVWSQCVSGLPHRHTLQLSVLLPHR